jgi:hypothetical protein
MCVKAFTSRKLPGVTMSLAALAVSRARAQTYSGSLPWLPGRTGAPSQVEPNGWTYLTPEEVAAIEALVDRLIPSDDLSPGGEDAGIAYRPPALRGLRPRRGLAREPAFRRWPAGAGTAANRSSPTEPRDFFGSLRPLGTGA